MVGITAEGYGWDFIWQNLQNFMGNSMLWYFFPFLVLLVLFAKNKEYRVIGFYPYLIFVITACNPYLITAAGSVIGLADRYYRFFWLLPLGLMFGVAMAYCLYRVKEKIFRVLLSVAVVIMVVLIGSPVYLGSQVPGYLKTETEYFNSARIVRLSDEIHKNGIENPVVAHPDGLLYDMCQYDSNHISILGRGEAVSLMNNFSHDLLGKVIEEKNYELMVKYLFLSGLVDWVSPQQLREAFTNYHVDYFVIPESQNNVLQYYEAAGCTITGETDGYFVLFTNLK